MLNFTVRINWNVHIDSAVYSTYEVDYPENAGVCHDIDGPGRLHKI